MPESVLRLFVSSPSDVPDERKRVDIVVERLNAEFKARARIEVIRWETAYYSAHETFQKQVPEAAECHLVVAIFRGRLGTSLPRSFPRQPSGEPYPSGTAYEVLSAIEARKAGKDLPDIYVFRYPDAPLVVLDDPDRAEIEAQWQALKGFFDTWFKSKDGEFLAAFQGYGSTDEFARKLEDCLRQWLARHGVQTLGSVWDRLLRGSPFPGLTPFDADRGPVFFGRSLEIDQALGRLREAAAREAPFLLVIGASGSGKSSLLRAGLMPQLTAPGAVPEIDLWRKAVVVPGADPFSSFAKALLREEALGPELRLGMFHERELLARLLAGDPRTAVAPIRDALDRASRTRQKQTNFAEPRSARLALAIDQAERLLVENEPSVARTFAELVALLVQQRLAYVILVLRSDAYPRFQGMDALVSLREAGATFDLLPPTAAELEEIVTRPVAACRPELRFERQGVNSLAAKLVADAMGGDVLPLLQMTLSHLYAAEAARGDGVLRFVDYRGMDAAVTDAANQALDAVPKEARGELAALVAGLVRDVTADPLTGTPIPVITALDRMQFEAKRPARKTLIDAFVAKRLLTSEGDGLGERIRPTHEALLRIWPQAQAIMAENASLIRVRHTLTPIVREWEEADAQNRRRHLEISPALLDGTRELDARFGEDLPEAMRAFITAAQAADAERRGREDRRRRQILSVIVSALIVMSILAGTAAWQWRQAEAQRQRAERALRTATDAANRMVSDLAVGMRDRLGMRIDIVREILDRAQALQRQLIDSGESAADLRFSEALALNNVIIAEVQQGDRNGDKDVTAALATASRFRAIMDDLVRRDPANPQWQRYLSFSFNRDGDVLMVAGRYKEALEDYGKSAKIRETLAELGKDDPQAQDDLAAAYEKMGDARRALGQYAMAYEVYEQSAGIRERLVAQMPESREWRRNLGLSYERMGAMLFFFGRYGEAMGFYAKSIAIREKLVTEQPANTQYQRDLSISYEGAGLASTRDDKGLDTALSYFTKSFELRSALSASDPGALQWLRDLAVAYGHMGDVLKNLGRREGALDAYRKDLDIREQLAAKDQDNAVWQSDLVIILRSLALAGDDPRARLTRAIEIVKRLEERGKLTESQKDWRAALEDSLASLPK
jgi:tetratricopeptide (TPR) repeat protein